jgi:hypothetical protein
MALQGTLKDFGIADILQLIGQQQKTGTLHLRSRDQEVHVGFRDGVIVRAESATRRKKDLIGSMLVRAELITEAQLQEALEAQRRSLKRLGDVLVSMRAISAERFRRMAQLQVNETLYGLFSWKSGTYAFEQGEVAADDHDLPPIRAESVLMEGFRRVDEWPLVRQAIPSDALTFAKRRELPAPAPAAPAGDADLDAAFGEAGGGGASAGELQAVGPNEHAVWARVQPGRTVRQLVDVCLLGEFETCKALHNLVSLGHLEPVLPASAHSARRGRAVRRAAGVAFRAALAVGSLVLLGLLAARVSAAAPALSRGRATSFEDAALQRHLSGAQQARIRAALDVYRRERGQLPATLDALVGERLLSEGDLRFPWSEPYHYRRVEAAADPLAAGEPYVLLPPLR